MAFKSFEALTTALNSLRKFDDIRALVNRMVSRLDNLRANLTSIPGAYTTKYNSVQLLQYDSDGKLQDVTPSSQLSVPNSVLAAGRDGVLLSQKMLENDAGVIDGTDKFTVALKLTQNGSSVLTGPDFVISSDPTTGEAVFNALNFTRRTRNGLFTPNYNIQFSSSPYTQGPYSGYSCASFGDENYPVYGVSLFHKRVRIGNFPDADGILITNMSLRKATKQGVIEQYALDNASTQAANDILFIRSSPDYSLADAINDWDDENSTSCSISLCGYVTGIDSEHYFNTPRSVTPATKTGGTLTIATNVLRADAYSVHGTTTDSIDQRQTGIGAQLLTGVDFAALAAALEQPK